MMPQQSRPEAADDCAQAEYCPVRAEQARRAMQFLGDVDG
jgi:hypothetical protein